MERVARKPWQKKGDFRKEMAFRLIWEAGGKGRTQTQIRDAGGFDNTNLCAALWQLEGDGLIVRYSIPREAGKHLDVVVPGPNAAAYIKKLELKVELPDETPKEEPPKKEVWIKCGFEFKNQYGKAQTCILDPGHEGPEHSSGGFHYPMEEDA